ncbi:HER134Cp [Eremothecium sinecaudum]|uniref:HER134Cp n=1 Tax=Eremothecium sinecaudum TaxID=45286 RepID=A0A0X8HU22_9SACH|nr:HER134Cp [Eremothecium sinecaudum]AMD21413.1 HER134Cp [Eremothecium sinecaudum]
MSDLAAELGFDPNLKKKKKTKKAVPEDFASTVESTPDGGDIFAGLKKKKKSKESSKDAEEVVDTEVNELSEVLGDFKLKKKKKKTKEVRYDEFDKELEKAGVAIDDLASQEGSASIPESAFQQDMGLPYSDLLSRFFKILRANNPELAGDRSGPKFRIPPPICQRDGKKTIFANIQEISEKLQRSTEHLIQYLFAELGTSGSVDGQRRLVIKGKFQSKQMENVLRRYIMEYVTCKTCKSINTELKKEQSNRLFFLVCKSCGSTRSVSSIKTGFQATVKRKRF